MPICRCLNYRCRSFCAAIFSYWSIFRCRVFRLPNFPLPVLPFTWFRPTVSQQLNIGSHSAWRKASDRTLWRRIVDTQHSIMGHATEQEVSLAVTGAHEVGGAYVDCGGSTFNPPER